MMSKEPGWDDVDREGRFEELSPAMRRQLERWDATGRLMSNRQTASRLRRARVRGQMEDWGYVRRKRDDLDQLR